MEEKETKIKTVLITGASGGIGSAIVKKFVGNGCFVIGLDIKKPEYEHEHFRFFEVNLRNLEEVEKVKETLENDNIKIDTVINAAGIYDLNSLIEMSEEDFIRSFDINVFAMFRVNRTFVPLLNKDGKILMISSELGPLDPLPFTGIYGITKSTVEKYAYSLRMELQLLDIKVVIVRPGAIDTGLLDISTKKLEEFTNKTEHYKYNSSRFKKIVDGVENKKIAPEKLATLILKIHDTKKPRYVYKINRNPLLLILNSLPQHFQNWVIKKILS